MKHEKNTLLSIFLALSLLVVSVPQASSAGLSSTGVTLLSSSIEEIRFTVQVPWQSLSLETLQLESGTFTRVSLPGSADLAETGAPQLPLISQMLGVPFGAALGIKITPGRSHTLKIASPVSPVPTQRAEWNDPLTEIEILGLPTLVTSYEPDPTIYAGSGVYPAQQGEIANDGVLRQQRVVGIALYPVQYKPSKSELTIVESFDVVLTLSGSMQINHEEQLPESDYYEDLFSRQLLNYQDATGWRSATMALDNLSDEQFSSKSVSSLPWLPPDSAWRVKIREEGFYQLNHASLSASGLDVENLDPRTFRMYHLGQEIAIQVTGEEDGLFDTSDRILFYGQALQDKYTLDNVYWLTYGGENGLRMEGRQVNPPTAPLAQKYITKTTLEVNTWYFTNVTGPDEFERFLWAGIIANAGVITPPASAFNYTFSLLSPVEETGQLDLDLYGMTEHLQGYLALFSINGTPLGSLEWAGQTWAHFSAAIPAGILVPGNNTLTISLDNTNGTIADLVYLDRGELTFSSSFQASADTLNFTYNLTQETGFELQAFSSDQLVLFDVSNQEQPVSLTGFAVQAMESEFKMLFQEGEGVTGSHKYWAAATSALKFPYAIQQDTPSTLQLPVNGADYLIITHSEFLVPAQTLADYREAQGLRTAVINVQDIYDQFGYGIVGRDPIRGFLEYAYNFWATPAPSFVVLLGDGQYNPKGFNPSTYGAWRENYIPPFLAVADPMLGETAADNRYSAIVGNDTLPDMMLGRMAVRSVAQATAFVNKIIAYEQTPEDPDWSTKVLAVAENSDKAGNFPAISEFVLQSSLPQSYQVERVYLGVTHMTMTTAKAAVIAAINNGKYLVNYIGHAAQTQWSGYDDVPAYSGRFLGNADVDGLTNLGKYPIISAMTCWEGYYINPQTTYQYESLAEVITRVENKGAVASWSPTGASVADGHDIINRAFFDAIFKVSLSTIGEATQKSLLDLWATGTHLQLVDTFLLFGDPALLNQHVKDLKNFLPIIQK